MAHGRGWLMVDHRNSPGISEELARQAGFDPKLVREGKVFEVDTLTCSHCRVVVVPNPFRKTERATCAKCGNHYICDVCAFHASMPDYDHTPFEKRVALAFAGKLTPQGSPPNLLIP